MSETATPFELPAWLGALRADPEVAKLGLTFLDADKSRELAAELTEEARSGPRGVIHTSTSRTWSAEIVADAVPVARGPRTAVRAGVATDAYWFARRSNPTLLYFSPLKELPGFLWVPVEPTADGVREVLADYTLPAPTPESPDGFTLHDTYKYRSGARKAELTGVARGYMGRAGEMQVPNPYDGQIVTAWAHDLARYFTTCPFLDLRGWGGAFDDNPWPDAWAKAQQAGQANMAAVARLNRDLMAQARGKVWSLTHETACSGAYFSVEFHHQTYYVANIRYWPATSAAHRRVVAAYNLQFREQFPVDCPLDAIAVLMGWSFVPSEAVHAGLDPAGDANDFASDLRLMSALRHNDSGAPHDPSAVGFYLAVVEHEDVAVRRALAHVAWRYKITELMKRLSEIEIDPDLKAAIDGTLSAPDWEIEPHPPEPPEEGTGG